MAVLQGIITQNVPGNTQVITFSNPSTLDTATFGLTGITYPIASTFTLSQADMVLYNNYNILFYTALFYNFPLLNSKFAIEIPVSTCQIQSLSVPNTIAFTQTSAGQPVFTINYNRSTKIATFSARSSGIVVTIQEFLYAYQVLLIFMNQVAIA